MLKIQVEIKLTKDNENKQPRFILSSKFKREIKNDVKTNSEVKFQHSVSFEFLK